MTLSLCMIVKNEEQVLTRCLESITDCFDEIIILDTGSTDKTKEIAKRYTSFVYETEWKNDFSLARNEVFSYASGDYIMWMDADDILTEENKQKLIALKKGMDGTVDLYLMNYATAYDENNVPTFYFQRERIVRRNAPHHWEGVVHETLHCNGRRQVVEMYISHKSVKKSYSRRNLLIFESKLAADGFLPPREQFYYARELFYHKQYLEAQKQLSAYLASPFGWTENRIEAYLFLSKCFEQRGDISTALQTLFISFYESLPRSETACEIGRLHMLQERYTDAIWWYRLALENSAPPTEGAFINQDYVELIPCLQLCVCFDKIKDYTTAKYYHDRIAVKRPENEAVRHNQRYFQALEQKGIIQNNMD